MRHVVFIIGSRDEFRRLAPVLGEAAGSGIRLDIWYTGETGEDIDDLVAGIGGGVPVARQGAAPGTGRRRTWWFSALAGCYGHVHSLRTWTRSAPLVVITGATASSFAGALAGRFGGGWVAQIDSGMRSGGLLDGLVFRLTNFALCPDDRAFATMRHYHCKAVNLAESPKQQDLQIVDNLGRWSR